jgi:hypothetical protein
MAAVNQHTWRRSRGGEGFTSGFHFYLYTHILTHTCISVHFLLRVFATQPVVSHFWRQSVAITYHLVAKIHDLTQCVKYAVLLRAFTSSKIIAVVQKILHIVEEYELRLQGMPFVCVRPSILIILKVGAWCYFFYCYIPLNSRSSVICRLEF